MTAVTNDSIERAAAVYPEACMPFYLLLHLLHQEARLPECPGQSDGIVNSSGLRKLVMNDSKRKIPLPCAYVSGHN